MLDGKSIKIPTSKATKIRDVQKSLKANNETQTNYAIIEHPNEEIKQIVNLFPSKETSQLQIGLCRKEERKKKKNERRKKERKNRDRERAR